MNLLDMWQSLNLFRSELPGGIFIYSVEDELWYCLQAESFPAWTTSNSIFFFDAYARILARGVEKLLSDFKNSILDIPMFTQESGPEK